MDKLALPDNLADWQDRFKRIEKLAEDLWAQHWDRMQALALELDEIHDKFCDAVIDAYRGSDDDDKPTEIAWEAARNELYSLSGYFTADTAIGIGAHGDLY